MLKTNYRNAGEGLFVYADVLQVAVLFSTTDSDKNEHTVKDP